MQDEQGRAAAPGFWHGVFAGFAGFVVLVQLSLALEFSDYRGMYADFAAPSLPLLTRITIHPAWLWGVPLLGGAAVAWLLVRRPRSLAPYLVAAIAIGVLAAASYYFPRAPIYALAGHLSD